MSYTEQIVRNGKFVRKVSGIAMAAALLFGCGASVATAATICVTPSGAYGCAKTISAALEGGAEGDIILVYPGTYKEQVTIIRPVSLISVIPNGATIDAAGQANGIFINGMYTAPNIEYSNVVVSGFNVQNANFEGILVLNVGDVTLTGNHVRDNDKALSGGTCPGIPPFETSEDDDCGEGIHLMGAVDASVVRNTVEHNAGGILITDETGPNHDNLVSGNVVQDNIYDCGITMASHPPATYFIPDATLPYGVFHNTISHNLSARNGTSGSGAGIGIFAPGPGNMNYGNVVIDNVVIGNANAGVAMHNHGVAPTPPVKFNNNKIIGNHFSGNGADSGDAATSGPVGINIFSHAPMDGTTISQNTFDQEAIDVAFNAPSGQLSAHFNNFNRGAVGVANLGSGTANATENWWGCVFGPGHRGCATTSGTVVSTPWLLLPFAGDSH